MSSTILARNRLPVQELSFSTAPLIRSPANPPILNYLPDPRRAINAEPTARP
ncbi:MAG: hypothetical protein AAGK09_08515 [Planctomycetota bacterium]